jgi:ribosomal protein L33
MMNKLIVAVCSEIRTKRSRQSEHRVEFLKFNLVVRKETARV